MHLHFILSRDSRDREERDGSESDLKVREETDPSSVYEGRSQGTFGHIPVKIKASYSEDSRVTNEKWMVDRILMDSSVLSCLLVYPFPSFSVCPSLPVT